MNWQEIEGLTVSCQRTYFEGPWNRYYSVHLRVGEFESKLIGSIAQLEASDWGYILRGRTAPRASGFLNLKIALEELVKEYQESKPENPVAAAGEGA